MPNEETAETKPADREFEANTRMSVLECHRRLDRIEQILVKLDCRLEDQALARRSWQVFGVLLAIHSFGVAAALTFENWFEGVALWGWLAGACTTLCTWHGLSLRPFLQRWMRSAISIVVVATTIVLVYDTTVWDLFEASLPWITLCGFGAILAAMLVRSLFHCGYAAPDGARIHCEKFSLLSIFKFSSLFAVLFAGCRFLAWWLSSEGSSIGPEGVVPIALLGIGQGGILSATLIWWSRDTRWFWCVLIAMVVLLLSFKLNVLLFAIASLLLNDAPDMPANWNEFLGFIPYFAMFTGAQILPPVLTVALLHSAGHRIVHADLSSSGG